MTVRELTDACGFGAECVSDGDRHVNGAYVGDLLSWVMGRAGADNVWITIMSNVNVIAVASLSDVSCVVLAEGVLPSSELITVARDKGVNLLTSPFPVYETAVKISEILK